MICAALGLVLLQTEPAPPANRLGVVTLLGREVPIELPNVSAPFAPGTLYTVGEERVRVSPAGGLVARFRDREGWADVSARYRAINWVQAPATWRVKVVLLPRVDILDRAASGLVRPRRGEMAQPQIDATLRELALFQAMAEAEAGGRLRVGFNIETDPDAVWRVASPGVQPLSADWVQNWFGPRLNRERFDADDGVDRGPFSSVFVIHAGLADSPPTLEVNGNPLTAIGFYTHAHKGEPGGLARSLFGAWREHIALRLQAIGSPVAGASQAPVGHEAWPRLTSRGPVADADYVNRRWPQPGSDPERIWPDPLANLRFQATEIPVETAGDAKLDGVFVPGREAMVRLEDGTLAVDSEFAELVSATSKQPLTASGWTVAGGRVLILFRSAIPLTGDRETDLLNLGDAETRTSPPLVGLETLVLAGEGNFAATENTVEGRGTVITVTERGANREGSARLFVAPEGRALFAGGRLSFAARKRVEDPFALVLRFADGTAREIVLGRLPAPAEGPTPPPAYPLTANGEWQNFSVDLGEGAAPVVEILVAAPRFARQFERSTLEPATLEIAELAVADGTGEATAPGETPTPANEIRAQEIATSTDARRLIEALGGNNELIRLNAADALSRVKAPEAIPALSTAAKTATPFLVDAAMRALAFQDTPDAWAAVRQGLEVGPYEFNRDAAATALIGRNDARNAGPLSVMFTARSAHGRLAAVRALGSIRTDAAQLILLTFLQELSPNVRLAVVESLDSPAELVNRRLMWYAVNDPSEAVRAACALRLLASRNAEYRAEGAKSARDESMRVRMRVLQGPVERPVLLTALEDARAEVRAVALRELAKREQPVEAKELTPVLADEDPRVQSALLDLARAKSLALPAEAQRRLESSRDPEVARRARER